MRGRETGLPALPRGPRVRRPLLDSGDTGAVTSVQPQDFDSGRVWIAFEVLAVVVFLASIGVLGLVLFDPLGVTVEGPSAVPAAHPYSVVVGADGEEHTVVECPSVVEAIGEPTDSFCADQTRDAVRFGLWTAGVTIGSAALFVASRRRRRWLRAERARLAHEKELLTYRQDSMPWSYWVAFVVVGGFGALNVAVLIAEVVTDWRSVNPRGGFVWAGITYTALWVYGRRRAFQLAIVEDDLEWRSPLRTERSPLASITSAHIRREGVVNERRAILCLADGGELSVVVPNGRHERRFRAFCDAVAHRSQTFEIDAATD